MHNRRTRARGRALGVLTATWLCLLLAGTAQADDRLDPSFGAGGFVEAPVGKFDSGPVAPNIWDLAADGSGMVAALADLTKNEDYFGLARYESDGSLDSDFGEEGFTPPLALKGGRAAQTQAVVVQPSGRIVAAGFRPDIVRSLPLLAGYRADGSLDPGFGTGGLVAPKRAAGGRGLGSEVLHDLALRPNGGLIGVGSTDEHPINISWNHPAGVVVAYTPDGRIDRSFGKRGRVFFPAPGDEREYTGLRAVQVLPDGRILVAGFHYGSIFLARLRPNGRLDRSFGGGDGKVVKFVGSRRDGCFKTCWVAAPLALQPDGSIVVLAATFPDVPVLLRFHPNGGLDRSFGRSGQVRIKRKGHRLELFGLGLQGGRIVLTGWDEAAASSQLELHLAVLRYLPDGSRDYGFGSEGAVIRTDEPFSGAFATLAQPEGRLVVGGGGQDKAEGDPYYASSLCWRASCRNETDAPLGGERGLDLSRCRLRRAGGRPQRPQLRRRRVRQGLGRAGR
jgi:uncharacterized delta-60 repeat protein